MDFSFTREAFGLDIADDAVRVVKLKKTRAGLVVSSYGENKIPAGTIEGGEVKDARSLSLAVKNLLEKEKGENIKTDLAVVSLPEEATFIRVIRLPKMSAEEAKRAALFEAENHIPLSLPEVYIDLEILENAKMPLREFCEVLIVASPKKYVDSYIVALEEAGIKPAAIDTKSRALAQSLVKNFQTDAPVLLIDFGSHKTNVAIFQGANIMFSAIIPISTRDCANAIQKAMGINPETAFALQAKHGLSSGAGEPEAVFEAMVPALTDLAEQIKKYVEFYQNKNPDLPRKINRGILCGNGANLKGIEEFLTSSLGLAVEIGDVWQNIISEQSKEIPIVSLQDSFVYAPAIGDAIRGVNFDEEKYD